MKLTPFFVGDMCILISFYLQFYSIFLQTYSMYMYIFTANIFVDCKENCQEKDGKDKHKNQDSGYIWSEVKGEKTYRELQKD